MERSIVCMCNNRNVCCEIFVVKTGFKYEAVEIYLMNRANDNVSAASELDTLRFTLFEVQAIGQLLPSFPVRKITKKIGTDWLQMRINLYLP